MTGILDPEKCTVCGKPVLDWQKWKTAEDDWDLINGAPMHTECLNGKVEHPPPPIATPPVAEPGSAGSPGSVGSSETPKVRINGPPLDEVRHWFGRFICAVDDTDLDILTLWAAHTHLCFETYTTPRLILDSPVPGSGKTTVLEHLERLCFHPVQMSSLSSPALLTRMLDTGMRTMLIDEADRCLNPDNNGVGELLGSSTPDTSEAPPGPSSSPSRAADRSARNAHVLPRRDGRQQPEPARRHPFTSHPGAAHARR